MEAMEGVGFTSMDCYPAVNIQAKMFASVSQELGFPFADWNMRAGDGSRSFSLHNKCTAHIAQFTFQLTHKVHLNKYVSFMSLQLEIEDSESLKSP